MEKEAKKKRESFRLWQWDSKKYPPSILSKGDPHPMVWYLQYNASNTKAWNNKRGPDFYPTHGPNEEILVLKIQGRDSHLEGEERKKGGTSPKVGVVKNGALENQMGAISGIWGEQKRLTPFHSLSFFLMIEMVFQGLLFLVGGLLFLTQ